MANIEREIMSAIESLRSRRYPNLLINQSTENPLSEGTARSIAAAAGLHFLNFRDEVLPNASEIKLGAYARGEFQEWLNVVVQQHGGLLLTNADPLISTWDQRDRKAFYKEFLLNGVNYGPSTVLVSWLGSTFDLEEVHNGEIKVLHMNNLNTTTGD
jgi:hypothetical protein